MFYMNLAEVWQLTMQMLLHLKIKPNTLLATAPLRVLSLHFHFTSFPLQILKYLLLKICFWNICFWNDSLHYWAWNISAGLLTNFSIFVYILLHTFTMVGCKEIPVNIDVLHFLGADWIFTTTFSVIVHGSWEKEWDISSHHNQKSLQPESVVFLLR